MAHVDVVHHFSGDPDRVFAYLSEHENLAPLLGAKITRMCNGDNGSRNGAGSRRSLKIGPLPAFEETNTEVVPGQLIRYRITRGGVLQGHRGLLRFARCASGGTDFQWTIDFGARVPGVAALVAKLLTRSITRAMPSVERATA